MKSKKLQAQNVTGLMTVKHEDSATLYMYGMIAEYYYSDEKVTSDMDVVKALIELKAEGIERIDLRLNCIGGSMMLGDAIVNAVKTSGLDVHVWVDGVAASMAAMLFLSLPKEKRHMAANGKLMLHEGNGGVYGTAKDMREAAALLETFNSAAIAQLSADTGMSEDDIRAAYFDGKDHWLTSQESLEAGFISAIEDYTAENTPANVESMTQAEIENFYSPKAQTKEDTSIRERVGRLIGKVAAIASPEPKPQPIITENSDTDMKTIEELKAAIDAGDINIDEVTAHLTAEGYTVEAPKPAPTPEQVTAEAIAAAVEAGIAKAVKPLNETIESLQTKVTALGKLPGDTPTVPIADADPTDAPVEMTDAEAALKKQNEVFAKAIKSDERVRFEEA